MRQALKVISVNCEVNRIKYLINFVQRVENSINESYKVLKAENEKID